MLLDEAAECIIARVSGEAYQKVTAWRNDTDLQVIQSQIARNGSALVVRLGTEHRFHRLTELPKPGEAEPFYGTFGGGYEFCFAYETDGWQLQISNFAHRSWRSGLSAPLPPLLIDDTSDIQVEALPTLPDGLTWTSPRGLRTDGREEDSDEAIFSIDGEMYERLTTWGWAPAWLTQYRYIFVPLSVGCKIVVEHTAKNAQLHLTEDVEW